jgi:uncharacterized protein (DUF608 family)
MAFIGLLVVLFIGQVFMNESFYNYTDASGTDTSGNITLTLSDLLALLGSGASKEEEEKDKEDDYDYLTKDKYYRNMRADMMADVKNAVRKELLNGKYNDLYGGDSVLDDSCIDSFSSQQGADFMKYIPGKNPDDYIRKDSVPCYGCSLP